MSEPSEKAREMVRRLSVASRGSDSREQAEAWDALLDYIAPMERDHRAMERLRKTGGRVNTTDARNAGDPRRVWIAAVGNVQRSSHDPADAILGDEDD